MASEDSIRFWKMTGAVVFLITVLVFGYAQYRKARPSQDSMRAQLEAREDAPVRQERPGGQEGRRQGPPSEEERQQRRAQFMADLNLTPEQQTKMEEIDKQLEGKEGRERFQARREAMEEILTEEQKEKMRSQRESRREEMKQRRLNEASSVCSSEECEAGAADPTDQVGEAAIKHRDVKTAEVNVNFS